SGGAGITLEGGQITVNAPGTVTIHASATSFEGATRQSMNFSNMPTSGFTRRKFMFVDETGQRLANVDHVFEACHGNLRERVVATAEGYTRCHFATEPEPVATHLAYPTVNVKPDTFGT